RKAANSGFRGEILVTLRLVSMPVPQIVFLACGDEGLFRPSLTNRARHEALNEQPHIDHDHIHLPGHFAQETLCLQP
ncbi:hypothetical protein, partial [Tahibacter caeni]|uniref:hypothetical protein n=1 Tax=Tahibacter caeni TaxID=1453545 RepID=UPI0021495522